MVARRTLTINHTRTVLQTKTLDFVGRLGDELQEIESLNLEDPLLYLIDKEREKETPDTIWISFLKKISEVEKQYTQKCQSKHVRR